MTLFLAAKLLIVLIFLIMFVRRPSLVWGIGLLTVTTAVLLDTLLDTFDQQALQDELGFFYFVLAGSIFAGATAWLLGLLLPLLRPSWQPTTAGGPTIITSASPAPQELTFDADTEDGGFDVTLIRREIHDRLDREDVLDLIFDLEIPENDVLALNQEMDQLIHNILAYAQREGKMGELALAVERTLTPLPVEHLPRLEKVTSVSPPTILRQILLANYTLAELETFSTALGVDWEMLDSGAKREKTRSLLQYLYRRNRIPELIDMMHDSVSSADDQVSD